MQFINFSTVVLLASALSVNALPTPAPEGGIAILATRTPPPAKPATWLSTRRDVESSDGLFSSTIDEANEALEKRAAPPPPTGVLAPVLKKIHGLRPKKGEEIQGFRGPYWFHKQNNVKGPVRFVQPLKKSSWWKPWTKLPKWSKRPVWINSAHPPQSKPSVPYKPRFQKYNPFKNGMLGGTKAPKDATPGTPKDVTPGTPKDTTPETPKDATPGTPKDTTPETPKDATPGTPKDTTPETPKDATPGTPKDTTPETPKDATPGTPKDTTPEPAPRDAAAQPPPQ